MDYKELNNREVEQIINNYLPSSLMELGAEYIKYLDIELVTRRSMYDELYPDKEKLIERLKNPKCTLDNNDINLITANYDAQNHICALSKLIMNRAVSMRIKSIIRLDYDDDVYLLIDVPKKIIDSNKNKIPVMTREEWDEL